MYYEQANEQLAKENHERLKIIEQVGWALGMKYPSENRECIVPRIKKLIAENEQAKELLHRHRICTSEYIEAIVRHAKFEECEDIEILAEQALAELQKHTGLLTKP